VAAGSLLSLEATWNAPRTRQVTGLADVPPVKQRLRAKAARALLRYTESAIVDLQTDEEEMLRGALHGRS
jgi:hypothetical protein